MKARERGLPPIAFRRLVVGVGGRAILAAALAAGVRRRHGSIGSDDGDERVG